MERSSGAHGTAGPPARPRPMAASGGGAGRLLQPPGPRSGPESALSGPGVVYRTAGMESVGLGRRNACPRIAATGAVGAAKRARQPVRGTPCSLPNREPEWGGSPPEFLPPGQGPWRGAAGGGGESPRADLRSRKAPCGLWEGNGMEGAGETTEKSSENQVPEWAKTCARLWGLGWRGTSEENQPW